MSQTSAESSGGGNLIRDLIDTELASGKLDRKVKGTIHWASIQHATDATIRLNDRLFNVRIPGAGADFRATLNPESKGDRADAKLEPAIELEGNAISYQFDRLGYFITDYDTMRENPFFNRAMTLRESGANVEMAG